MRPPTLLTTLLLALPVSSQVVPPDVGVADATLTVAGQANQHFGFSLASGADWDGDGRDDVAAGGATTHGSAGTAKVRLLCGLDAEKPREFVVQGLASSLWGVTVALVRDLDGGGRADLVLGMPEWTPAPEDPAQHDVGKVCIFLGERWAGTTTPQTAGAADVVLFGTRPHWRFGWSVADAGDVDGDGLCELLVGAPGCDPDDVQGVLGVRDPAPRDFAGQALLFFGAAGGLATGDAAELPAAVAGLKVATQREPGTGYVRATPRVRVFEGAQARDRYGFAVMGLGDLSGDGCAEFGVGAIQGHRQSAVGHGAFADASGGQLRGYVDILGGECERLLSRVRPDVPGTGKAAALFGSAIARLGDLDGDGLAEVIIGAPGTYRLVDGAPELPRGAVFVYSGGPLARGEAAPPLVTSLDLFDPRPDGQLELSVHAQLGFSVAGGDGPLLAADTPVPDLAAGAWGQHQMNGAVLVLRPDLASGTLRVLRRIGGSAGDKSRFGSALVLGRVRSERPALVAGSHGQALPGSEFEEGHVHVFELGP